MHVASRSLRNPNLFSEVNRDGGAQILIVPLPLLVLTIEPQTFGRNSTSKDSENDPEESTSLSTVPAPPV